MFDAIVIGSGMSGGWAAKELTERGLKTLVIERGRHIEHRKDYLDQLDPWELPNFGMVDEKEAAKDYAIQSACYAFNTGSKQYWVKDSEHPYTYPADKPFMWIRGYHLGGRSIMWGRHSYRMAPLHFRANAEDGHGVRPERHEGPVGERDLAGIAERQVQADGHDEVHERQAGHVELVLLENGGLILLAGALVVLWTHAGVPQPVTDLLGFIHLFPTAPCPAQAGPSCPSRNIATLPNHMPRSEVI